MQFPHVIHYSFCQITAILSLWPLTSVTSWLIPSIFLWKQYDQNISMEIPLAENKMGYCITENRRKSFSKIKDLLCLWKLPGSIWESMKIESNMPTSCLYGKSVSNIFPWVLTKSKNFLHNYMLASKRVEDCSWALCIGCQIMAQSIFSTSKVKQESSLWSPKCLRKSLDKTTPGPLLLIKQTYCNSVLVNFDWYNGYSKPNFLNSHLFLLGLFHLCMGFSLSSAVSAAPPTNAG